MAFNYLPLILSVLAVSVPVQAPAADSTLEPVRSAATSGVPAGRALAQHPSLSQDLEPCINGAVSASGTFPNQAMERQIGAYLDWAAMTGQPFYLFRVAGDRLTPAFPQR